MGKRGSKLGRGPRRVARGQIPQQALQETLRPPCARRGSWPRRPTRCRRWRWRRLRVRRPAPSRLPPLPLLIPRPPSSRLGPRAAPPPALQPPNVAPAASGRCLRSGLRTPTQTLRPAGGCQRCCDVTSAAPAAAALRCCGGCAQTRTRRRPTCSRRPCLVRTRKLDVKVHLVRGQADAGAAAGCSCSQLLCSRRRRLGVWLCCYTAQDAQGAMLWNLFPTIPCLDWLSVSG